MTKALAIAAVAGLAGTASAQTLNITADVTSVGFGGTSNWTVSVTGITAANYLQVYDFNMDANDSTLGTASTFATALSALVGPTAGSASGASLLGASGGQSTLVDPLNAAFGDVVIGTFSVVAGNTEGTLSYSASDGGVLAADIIRGRTGSDLGPIAFNGPAAVNSDSVRITPTPASAALLGLGGLAAARRRR
ncbi:MAG: hypothetical protein RIB32_01765 [Phycisphaerales bacterium]